MVTGTIERTPWDATYEMFKDYVDYISPEEPPSTVDAASDFRQLIVDKCSKLCEDLINWYWRSFEQEWCNDLSHRYAFAHDLSKQIAHISSLPKFAKLYIFNLRNCSSLYTAVKETRTRTDAEYTRFYTTFAARLVKLRGKTLSEYVFGESFPCPITSLEFALVSEIMKLPLGISENLRERLMSCRSPLQSDMNHDPQLKNKVIAEKCVQKWLEKESPILPHSSSIYDFTDEQTKRDMESGTKRLTDYANQKRMDVRSCLGSSYSIYGNRDDNRADYLKKKPPLQVPVLMSIYSGMPLECLCSELPQPSCNEYYFLNRQTGEAMFLEQEEKDWLKLVFRLTDEQKMNLLIALISSPHSRLDFYQILA